MESTEQDVLTTTSSGMDETPAATEKMLSQDEVNRLVGREKAAAAEKARRQVEAEYAERSTQSNSAPKVDNEKIVEEVERRLKTQLEQEQEEAQQQQLAEEWRKVVSNYNNKLAETAKSGDYDDYDEVVRGIDHSKYDMVVWGATNLDNTGDIVYELAKNPAKAVNLETLGRHDQKAFERELKKLSDSIKANKEAAKNVSKAPEPYSRLKPQVAGVDTSSNSSDYASLKSRFRN